MFPFHALRQFLTSEIPSSTSTVTVAHFFRTSMYAQTIWDFSNQDCRNRSGRESQPWSPVQIGQRVDTDHDVDKSLNDI